MATQIEKSEILFLYESKFSIPNGDPFTGEQRYDEETKQVLVSDVRIKRFVRDYFIEQNALLQDPGKESKYEVYVFNDKSQITEGNKGVDSTSRINYLISKYAKLDDLNDSLEADKKSKKGKKSNNLIDVKELLKQCIDVRLFGGISTKEGYATNLTGPVQFALLNPSLNKVDLRIHQNTSVFSSSADKSRGAIGTTSVVPYALNKIHGWINAYSALQTDLTQNDIDELLVALWNSVNNANTRSKSNQNAVLLIQIIYTSASNKIYGIDKAIRLVSDKEEEQIRGMEDYKLSFENLQSIAASDKVAEVRFYTELPELKKQIEQEIGEKAKVLKAFQK